MKRFFTIIRTWYYILKYQHVMKRAVFGKGVSISCKLAIKGPGKVSLGDYCRLQSTVWGDEYVTIYTHQPLARVVIGNSVLLRATRFGSHLQITVQDRAVLENASIFDSDFHKTDATQRDQGFNAWDRPVSIGAGAYVGCESLCSKGSHVGMGSIILPVSMVGTKTVPEGKTVGGYPAKVVR